MNCGKKNGPQFLTARSGKNRFIYNNNLGHFWLSSCVSCCSVDFLSVVAGYGGFRVVHASRPGFLRSAL